MEARIEMRTEVADGALRLLSPGVGLFTNAVPSGRVLTPGQCAGQLIVLGRASDLMVPAGVAGVVRSDVPELVRAPVDWSSVLYELDSLDSAGALGEVQEAAAAADGGAAGLVVRAPQTGRFWHRAAPGEPAFASPGDELAAGDAIGLIEVMKTFTQVPYRPEGSLPETARVVRLLVGDGEDVAAGAALIEVEPAR